LFGKVYFFGVISVALSPLWEYSKAGHVSLSKGMLDLPFKRIPIGEHENFIPLVLGKRYRSDYRALIQQGGSTNGNLLKYANIKIDNVSGVKCVCSK